MKRRDKRSMHSNSNTLFLTRLFKSIKSVTHTVTSSTILWSWFLPVIFIWVIWWRGWVGTGRGRSFIVKIEAPLCLIITTHLIHLFPDHLVHLGLGYWRSKGNGTGNGILLGMGRIPSNQVWGLITAWVVVSKVVLAVVVVVVMAVVGSQGHPRGLNTIHCHFSRQLSRRTSVVVLSWVVESSCYVASCLCWTRMNNKFEIRKKLLSCPVLDKNKNKK